MIIAKSEKMLLRKFKIVCIHFIRKPLFVFWFKNIYTRSSKSFQANYFLLKLNYHSPSFIEKLIEIESKEKLLSDAEIVLQNKFKTLGSNLTPLGEKINWHKDFKSGRVWEKKFYTEIDSKHSVDGSDIKIPWELSRFHQAIWLGKAYLIANDEKYSEKYFDLISEWIDENPYCIGVNWNCAMEVAIRAVNWIISLHIFRSSKHFTKEIELDIVNSLYEHGLFIRNNLEYGRRNGNHYLSDLMGLVWIGGFFKNHSFGKRWINLARRELDKEIDIQIYDDGVDYEKSTFYQRLVAEILYNSQVALDLNGLSLSENSRAKLEKMFQFMYSYILEDTIPSIGDNDNGRVTQYSFDEKIDDLRYLICIGAILMQNVKCEMRNWKISSDALFLFGLEEVAEFESHLLKLRNPHSTLINLQSKICNLQSICFPQGGFYLMRSEEMYVFIDAGDIGMNGWGGHGHNDVFSFEFAYKGLRFIVDSGTYCYTSNSELRQRFRSTSSHNTIMIDDTEQAEFLNLFRIKKDLTKPRILTWESNSKSDILIAEHYGFTRLPDPVVHRRKFEFDKTSNQLNIIDTLEGRLEHKIDLFFHFHPSVEMSQISTTEFRSVLFNQSISLGIQSQLKEFGIKIEESKYSKSYGEIEGNKRLHLTAFSKFPVEIITKIKVA